MKKPEPNEIVNWWLNKFHNTTIEEVSKMGMNTREFYKHYAITEEQYEEFEQYFYKELPKKLGYSQKMWRRISWVVYINSAPSVKQ